jgi:heme/copper-type cytochrome/quinol oxidase subunit 4
VQEQNTMTTAEAHKSSGMAQDLVVYLCILALAAIQFVIAYQNIDGTQMFVRMLIVALVEAGLALLFFMHLWTEKRAFMWSAGIITIFVLLALQYSWTDSYRMEVGAPYSQPKAGVVQQ